MAKTNDNDQSVWEARETGKRVPGVCGEYLRSIFHIIISYILGMVANKKQVKSVVFCQTGGGGLGG